MNAPVVINETPFIASSIERWMNQFNTWLVSTTPLEYIEYILGLLLVLYILTTDTILIPRYRLSHNFSLLFVSILGIGVIILHILVLGLSTEFILLFVGLIAFIYLWYSNLIEKETNVLKITFFFGALIALVLNPPYGSILSILITAIFISGRSAPFFQKSIRTLKKNRTRSLSTGGVLVIGGSIFSFYALQTSFGSIIGMGMISLLAFLIFLGSVLSFSVIGNTLLQWSNLVDQTKEIQLVSSTITGYLGISLLLGLLVFTLFLPDIAPSIFDSLSSQSLAIATIIFISLLTFLIPFIFFISLIYSVGALWLTFWDSIHK